MNGQPQNSRAGPWLRRHRTLATLAGTAGTLAIAAALLWWHVSAVPDSTNSSHVTAGDFVFFGMVAALVVLAAGVETGRHRRG